jgi:hypothetical protein
MTAHAVSVTPASVLARSDDVLHQEVGGEAVLLDLASENYFGLDPVGSRIWELLDGHAPLQAVHARLCDEYDADPERIAADLMALAQSLVDAGLVKSA